MSRTQAHKKPAVPRRRNKERTRERILSTACEEFSQKGYTGARIEHIAHRSGANVRMIYHYFGGKDALYVAVLEQGLHQLRIDEQRLVVSDMPPVAGLLKLFDFVYDHFNTHRQLVLLLSGENLQRAAFLKRSKQVPKRSFHTIAIIKSLLARAQSTTEAALPDPLQLYVTMVALSYFHISNAHTLSFLFRTNLLSSRWVLPRKRHARAVLEAYLRTTLR